jgi:hypothetical protein
MLFHVTKYSGFLARGSHTRGNEISAVFIGTRHEAARVESFAGRAINQTSKTSQIYLGGRQCCADAWAHQNPGF